MAIPDSKQELIKAITDNFQKLLAELSNIPPDLTNKKELEGHAKNTLMSVKDSVAYLLGWGQLVLKWNDLISKGISPEFPETDYKWNELGLLAQKFYKDYEKDSYKTLLSKFENTVEEILKLIESKTNKELYGIPWYNQYTLGRMIQLNSSSPYKNTKDRIRKWKKGRQVK